MVARVGEAPVREQFLLPRPPPATEGTSRSEQGDGQPKKQKRKGGQNKNRRQPFRQALSTRLCASTIRNEECGVRECKKIHDKRQFLELRGPDLGEQCVLWEKFGNCCYGIACRYGSAHLDNELNSRVDEERWEKMKIYEVQKTLSKELLPMLRSRKVWFGRSYSHLEGAGINISNELAHHSKYTAKRSVKRAKVEGEEKEKGKEEEKETENTPPNTALNTSTELYDEIKDDYYCFTPKPSKKTLDLRGLTYLSPLTTVGNLPFRRICVEYGAGVTCGEMALAEDLLQGSLSEWALLKRHHSERIFGVQLCAASPLKAAKATELVSAECDVDFIDLNVGCPIDLVFNRGAGSALMDRAGRLEQVVRAMVAVSDVPISVKMRMGTSENKLTGRGICERLSRTGISHLVVHGRTRQQRYTKHADWEYIAGCRAACAPVPLFGNGDILSFEDYNERLAGGKVDGVMIGRGALIKPWIFQEIAEQRHIDISSSERLDMLRRFRDYGLEHWGTDTAGVEKTRHFLLEWLSFLYRYIPVGLLERLPQRINERPPSFFGRDDLETLMCSPRATDWIALTEMVLGKVPDGFNFVPKHVANSYS